MRFRTYHDRFLEQLVGHLNMVDEVPENVSWILKEGIWLKHKSTAHRCFCDLVLFYENDNVSCLELKSSPVMRHHAIEQLYSSRRFVRDCLGYEVTCLKVVYYDPKPFSWDRIA